MTIKVTLDAKIINASPCNQRLLIYFPVSAIAEKYIFHRYKSAKSLGKRKSFEQEVNQCKREEDGELFCWNFVRSYGDNAQCKKRFNLNGLGATINFNL